MGELREMAFEPGQLFGNIGAIGKKGDFLEQTIVVRRKLEPGLVDPLEQSCRDISPPPPDAFCALP